jgi:hypothetical protein
VVRPIAVSDQIGIPYILVGRPINVPDQIGIPYILVGRVFNPTPYQVGINSDLQRTRACALC